jgi:hypothetical protein
MLISPAKGRPFGGRVFMINKLIKIINSEFINKHVSYILFTSNNRKFCNIYTYLPYDDNTQLTLSEFISCLQIIGELFKFFGNKEYKVSIMGDFNADLLRMKRFDLILKEFIVDNDLHVLSPSYDPEVFSYFKGEYSAFLDHVLINNNLDKDNYKCNIIESDINLSDHKPLLINFKWNSDSYSKDSDYIEPINNLLIKLNPNLDNIEIYQKFNSILNENIISCMNIPIIDKNDHQTIINDMYSQFTSSIKNAYDSCCRTSAYNNIIKKKNWFTCELRKIKKEILELRCRNLAELIKMCERPRELLLEEFFERKLRPGETVSSFAKAIKTLLTEAEPTMSAETSHTLLLRQLGKSLPSHIRTQLNFNSRMEWNELLVNLDKSMPLESITPQWDLSTTQFPTSLIKQEPVEANWATTRARNQNNNSISYSDRSSDNRQQTRSMRFNGYCNYCDKFGHKEVDCRAKQRDQPRDKQQGQSQGQLRQPQWQERNRQPYQQQQRPAQHHLTYNQSEGTNRSSRAVENSSRLPANRTNENTSSINTNSISNINSNHSHMQQDQEFPYFTANLDTVDTNSCNVTTLLKARAQIFNQNF